jgi:hypothetical protein
MVIVSNIVIAILHNTGKNEHTKRHFHKSLWSDIEYLLLKGDNYQVPRDKYEAEQIYYDLHKISEIYSFGDLFYKMFESSSNLFLLMINDFISFFFQFILKF